MYFVCFLWKCVPGTKLIKIQKQPENLPVSGMYKVVVSTKNSAYSCASVVDGVFRAHDDDVHMGSRVYYLFLPIWDEI